MKKSLHKVKAQFSYVCSGLGRTALTMADTSGLFDFPKDMKAIISHAVSFQLYPSSIYPVKTGFKSSNKMPVL